MSLFLGMAAGGMYASAQAGAEAAGAGAKARRASADVQALEDRLDRTLLVCEALWTLLRDKLDMSDDQLAQRITELDLSDGKLDGKIRRPPSTCPKCSRTISPRFDRCMYCGQEMAHDPFV